MNDSAAFPARPGPDRPAIQGEPHISYCLLDADGRTLSARDEHRAFYAASTIKLHILIAALRAADAGILDLSGTIPATRTFTGHDGTPFTLTGDHLDPTHPADGEPITGRDLLVRMIDRSSNEATDAVIDLVGLDLVGSVIRELGLAKTRVERRIGDPSALAAGLTNETSAADLARTMRALANGSLLSPESTELALDALRAQRIRVIAAALPAGTDAGSKSGEIDGIRHDVAFIGAPDGASARHLAILTSGYAEPEANEAIRALTTALLER